MKAIGYYTPHPITSPDALVDIELPTPRPGPSDLLVAVNSVLVNPVDVKSRASAAPPKGEARILGFDAAGVVVGVGSEVRLFKPGDEVFYAGAINRPGTNSEFHLVDERIVGRKPTILSFSQAAALPLTSIMAWELLFDRLCVPYGTKTQNGTILIINGSSILTQIVRRLTGLTIVATASRPETIAWCYDMGAHHVIDHRRLLTESLNEIGIPQIEYVASLAATDRHLPAIAEAIAPQGRLALIDDPEVLDIVTLKRKSVSVHWEFMFTRSPFLTHDMIAQHRLLNDVTDLVDAGVLRPTLREDAGTINAANLKRVHADVESGLSFGKTVLSEF